MSWVWWHMSLFPAALGWQRQSQVGLSEFEASLVYNRASSRRARATQRDHVLKKQTKQTNKQTKNSFWQGIMGKNACSYLCGSTQGNNKPLVTNSPKACSYGRGGLFCLLFQSHLSASPKYSKTKHLMPSFEKCRCLSHLLSDRSCAS